MNTSAIKRKVPHGNQMVIILALGENLLQPSYLTLIKIYILNVDTGMREKMLCKQSYWSYKDPNKLDKPIRIMLTEYYMTINYNCERLCAFSGMTPLRYSVWIKQKLFNILYILDVSQSMAA